ncbi:MAG: transcriptional regulator NrdR [Kiritimatiellaeota bacterium]|nr:transcriptional regulator NrdR [Kiritimatiellota bacterium]
MRCPKCGHSDDKVLDSRSAREGASIRRRRQCLACEFRFTTYEEIVKDELRVIKRDGRHEEFSRVKLERGISRACEKRPISADQIHDLVDQIIAELEGETEVTSDTLGEMLMARLHRVDEVAYIRFASVYRRFADVNQFLRAVTDMVQKG